LGYVRLGLCSGYELWRLRLFSFGVYGLALAALALVLFSADDSYRTNPSDESISASHFTFYYSLPQLHAGSFAFSVTPPFSSLTLPAWEDTAGGIFPGGEYPFPADLTRLPLK